jgi:hypothetical protein
VTGGGRGKKRSSCSPRERSVFSLPLSTLPPRLGHQHLSIVTASHHSTTAPTPRATPPTQSPPSIWSSRPSTRYDQPHSRDAGAHLDAY